jgi:hypothetical protein
MGGDGGTCALAAELLDWGGCQDVFKGTLWHLQDALRGFPGLGHRGPYCLKKGLWSGEVIRIFSGDLAKAFWLF